MRVCPPINCIHINRKGLHLNEKVRNQPHLPRCLMLIVPQDGAVAFGIHNRSTTATCFAPSRILYHHVTCDDPIKGGYTQNGRQKSMVERTFCCCQSKERSLHLVLKPNPQPLVHRLPAGKGGTNTQTRSEYCCEGCTKTGWDKNCWEPFVSSTTRLLI